MATAAPPPAAAEPADEFDAVDVEEGLSKPPPPPTLEPEEAEHVRGVVGRLFEKLRLMSLLKVDPGMQASVSWDRVAAVVAWSSSSSSRANREMPNLDADRSWNPSIHPSSLTARPPLSLPYTRFAQAAEMSRGVGLEISRVMEKQLALETRFEELIKEQPELKARNHKAPFLANQKELHDVTFELRDTTEELCKRLKENPDVMDNIAFAERERAKLQGIIANLLVDLQTGTFCSMTKWIEDEKKREREIKETYERVAAKEAAVAELRQRIIDEREQHAEAMKQREATIGETKEKLKTAKAEIGVDLRYRMRDIEGEASMRDKVNDQALDDLRAEIEKVKKQIAQEKQAHKTTMHHLRKRVEKSNETLAHWQEKHKRDSEKMETEILKVKHKHEETLAKIKEIEPAYLKKIAEDDEKERQRVIWESTVKEREKKAITHARARGNWQLGLDAIAAFKAEGKPLPGAKKDKKGGKGKGDKKGGKKGKKK